MKQITINDLKEQNYRPLSLVVNPNKKRKAHGSLLVTRNNRLFLSLYYRWEEKGIIRFTYAEPMEIEGFTVINRKGLKELVKK